MNKNLKIILIIISCLAVVGLAGGTAALFFTNNFADADEYKLGNDTIKSIKAVVEKRQVTSLSTEVKNEVTTQKIEYKSDNVQDDLLKYTTYLRNQDGFVLTKDMDLSIIPSSIELGKTSNDEGDIIMMTIDYNTYGYTILIQKGEGSLSLY